jgi:hypothetical protein
MSNFKGTNKFKLTKFIFYERLRFKNTAYEDIDHTNLKEFDFSSFALYGKVNQQYDSVYLNESFLSPIKNSNKLAISFVSQAFNNIVERFKVANNLEIISNEEKYLTNVKCYDSYKSPVKLYENYMNDLLRTYNKKYLKNKKIRSFKDYVDTLLPYAKKIGSGFPMTFSSWIKSKRCPRNVSGLMINISNNNYGNDSLKEKDFINSKNFNFYVNTCKSNGFFVTERNPSVLIADFDSQQMRSVIEQNNLNTTSFFEMCELAYPRDIEFLTSKIVEYYDLLIQNAKYTVEAKVSRNNRSYIKIGNINNNYNINYLNNNILNIYTNIRNIEEDYPFGQADINEFINNAKKLEKRVDNRKAIDYINIRFRSTYASKYGGLNYYNKKFESMED